MNKSIVEPQTLQLKLPKEGFRLVSGEVLKEVSVTYEVYGRLADDKTNVIYICHPLTGDAHAASYHSEQDAEPGWWDPMIGPDKPIDTNKFFVICSNILGGCKGTTGPGSKNPDTGKPYGIDFPLVTIKDVVRVQKILLDQLGIPELYCVVGGSMGGMQALEWSVNFPEYVNRCICIASAVNLTSQALAFDIISRQSIESDPRWHNGDYYSYNDKPVKGLSRARQIGHVTYLSSHSMNSKFGRGLQGTKSTIIQPSKFSTNFQVESYLNYQGHKFSKRFDANSYLHISRMMDMFDLEKEYGSIGKAFANTKCHYLIVSISSDWLFPPSQSMDIISALISNRKPVSYFQLNSPYGHDAFLLEYEFLGQGVEAFLNGKVPRGMPESVKRMDINHISDMIDRDTHVLDVGSGSGELMWALKRFKHITGLCLDLDFDKIVECMRKGLPAIQLDADKGLGIIADDAFDCVLLNQTIQQLRSALQTIKQITRIAEKGVIGFPNFAYYQYRFALFFRGKLPVSNSLSFEWYNTPNIHLITVKDFRNLCQRHNINIEKIEYIADDVLGKMLLGFGLINLGSERSLARIRRARA